MNDDCQSCGVPADRQIHDLGQARLQCKDELPVHRFVAHEFTLVAQATLEGGAKPLFATEGELNGYKATQGRMDIGPGERPIEDLPMFAEQTEMPVGGWPEFDAKGANARVKVKRAARVAQSNALEESEEKK